MDGAVPEDGLKVSMNAFPFVIFIASMIKIRSKYTLTLSASRSRRWFLTENKHRFPRRMLEIIHMAHVRSRPSAYPFEGFKVVVIGGFVEVGHYRARTVDPGIIHRLDRSLSDTAFGPCRSLGAVLVSTA